MTDEELLYVELINTFYEKYGFKGVLEEISDRLEYGKVTEKEQGLYRITTGGWSDDEFLIHCLLNPISRFRPHYVGYLIGGAFYFSEDKDDKYVEIIKFLKEFELAGEKIMVKEDKMYNISEGLLEDIRHELISLTGLTAFDKCSSQLGYVEVFDEDRIELDYNELISKIDIILNEKIND